MVLRKFKFEDKLSFALPEDSADFEILEQESSISKELVSTSTLPWAINMPVVIGKKSGMM